MSGPLNVVALISGGKDSLYSILHCIQNGHKVVALANLHPQSQAAPSNYGLASSEFSSPLNLELEGEGNDLNSFMYQTVGHSIIPLYSEALGLPLYRRAITGSAVQTGRYYEPASTEHGDLDETEDLIPLLQEVKEHHPEINAISSGAILSTYQRTRIESIAVRLGLTPLAYLWQYPALPSPPGRGDSLTGLLDDMAAAGCDSRILKIASGGIKESLLWSNVADSRTSARLVTGMAPFFPDQEFWLRGAVLGEGGEYETLALNGPRQIWKKKISVNVNQNITLTGEGGASYVRPIDVRLAEQEQMAAEPLAPLVRAPSMLDPQFQSLTFGTDETPQKAGNGSFVQDGRSCWTVKTLPPPTDSSSTQSVSFTRNHVALSNITAVGSEKTASASSQMQSISTQVSELLASISQQYKIELQLSSSNIVSSTLLLASTSDFAAINPIYSLIFRSGEPNPPARVTIATDLPNDTKVSLSIVLDIRSRAQRRGLHVQSRSYWAPANIGPYSQAICELLDDSFSDGINIHDAGMPEIIHMAGQIPLVPQSMEILSESFIEQAALSLQHLWRIGQERGVDLWPWGVAFLEDGQSKTVLRARRIASLWYQAHVTGTRPGSACERDDNDSESESGIDAWDMQNNRSAGFHSHPVTPTVGKHLHILPNTAVLELSDFETNFVPPFIAAEIVSLPRDSPVEWWSLGLGGLPKSPTRKPRVRILLGTWDWGFATTVRVLPSLVDQEDGRPHQNVHEIRFITILVRQGAFSFDLDLQATDSILEQVLSSVPETKVTLNTQVVHGTAYIAHEGGWQAWSSIEGPKNLPGVKQIPCRNVWGTYSMTNQASGLPELLPLSLGVTVRIDVKEKS